MICISGPFTERPLEFKSVLQEKVYDILDALSINYERVETDEIITMQDCAEINKKLGMNMVKTLFLCNRSQNQLYLFVTRGDKRFKSKEFSEALGVSGVSFAPLQKMEEMLGTKVGAATIFSILLESAEDVELVLDKDIIREEYYGCSDGVTTGYMKIKTTDIMDIFLKYVKKKPLIIEI